MTILERSPRGEDCSDPRPFQLDDPRKVHTGRKTWKPHIREQEGDLIRMMMKIMQSLLTARSVNDLKISLFS
jgi:hypothetical protein